MICFHANYSVEIIPFDFSLFFLSLYIKVTGCNHVPMSLFHKRTARPISTKFCTDLPTNPGMVLSTSMTASTRPPDPRVPQTPKYVSSSNFSRAAPGPGWLVCYILCDVRKIDFYLWKSILFKKTKTGNLKCN